MGHKEYFVKETSIVRRIWGKSDTILFIFAGAAAEFALNRAVDWLYFTGKLPADPIARLFSTVSYARMIIFSEKEKAEEVVKSIADIHHNIEQKRGDKIPSWAYRDVLFMLIDYSIRSFELLEKKLHANEKKEIFDVFTKVGEIMKLEGLPKTFQKWKKMRVEHLETNLERSKFTNDLLLQYKKQLGSIRFKMMLEAQKLILPEKVKLYLGLSSPSMLAPLVPVYKLAAKYRLEKYIKNMLLPKEYKTRITSMDVDR